MISKPKEHDIDFAGRRLLRDALESLGWVLNEVQDDYGIDFNVQVFDGGAPTGVWFHVQLKSSASTQYSSDSTFVSQELPVDHARHYATEMRQPVLVIHVDVTSKRVFWHAPQLQDALESRTKDVKSVTLRIPTANQLPETAPDLLAAINEIYLAIANRVVVAASARSFAQSLEHFPNQAELHRAFREKADTMRLREIVGLFADRKFDQARPRAAALLADPDSAMEVKFWASVQLEAIDYGETLHAGRPQSELPRLILRHAKALQQLTVSGPEHLKLYAYVARRAAELEISAHEYSSLFMALAQHLDHGGNPMMVLSLYVRRIELTKTILRQYNGCVKLAQYAATYPSRWVLGRALSRIVNAIGRHISTLDYEGNAGAAVMFASSALQILKLAAWIGFETGDMDAVVMAIMGSALLAHTKDSDAYRWAETTARGLADRDVREDALRRLDRATRRWAGQRLEGDYHGNTLWDAIQNMATGLGLDLSDENAPIVRGLRIAVKDNSPERVLSQCEHLLVTLGATGPNARRIHELLNISTAGSKVVSCTLHDYHVEAREQAIAYREFKRRYCDSCPDLKPRPSGWKYTEAVRLEHQAANLEYAKRLQTTAYAHREVDAD